jgi:hypothetical protein
MTDEFDTPDFLDAFDFNIEFEPSLEGDERTVTIRTSGSSEVVPWREGMTLEDAFNHTGLVMRARADFYLDNATINMGTVLPAGAVVTAIGATQKGG